MKSSRLLGAFALVAAATSAALPGLLTAAPAAAVTPSASSVSSNWAGYVAGASGALEAGAQQFSSVSGSWVQPKAACSSEEPTSAAFWVGLGGNAADSDALEQTGTEADCSAGGTASYFAWYELVPDPSQRLSLAVHAGDKITASVSVSGEQVTVSLRDDTLGTSFARTITMANPDTSSAEWIAEAPSVCGSPGFCHEQPLTDFGKVTFTDTSAESAGHLGPIADNDWSSVPVMLQADSGGIGFDRFEPELPIAEAVPSSLSAAGSAFTVSWHQVTTTEPQVGGYGGGDFGGGGFGGGGFGGGGFGGGGFGGGGFAGY
jgi:hypothetical protein